MNKNALWLGSAVLSVAVVAGLWVVLAAKPSAPAPTVPKVAANKSAAVAPTAKSDQIKQIDAAALAPVFHWSAGARRHTYRYLSESAIKINTAVTDQGAQWQEVPLTLQGTLNLRVFDQVDDSIYLGFQLAPLTVTHGGQDMPALAQLYGRFFLVKLSPQGRFLTFYFPAYLTAPEEQGALSELVSSAQIVLPAPTPPPTEWDSEESHGSGDYTAHYRWQAGQVHKQKRAYNRISEIANQAWNGLKLSGKVLDSKTEARLGQPWLESLSQQEHLVFTSEYGKLAEIVLKFTLQTVTAPLDGDLEIWQMPDDPRQVQARLLSMHTLPAGELSMSDYMREARLKQMREQLAGIDVGMLLEGLRLAPDDKRGNQYKQHLMDYLALHPEAALELASLMKQNLYSGSVTATLVNALQMAGSVPAQQALLALMDDPREEARTLVTQAVMAAGGVARPDPLLINGLWQRVENQAPAHSTALLALGRLGGALDEAGDAVSARDIRERLGAYLQQPERTDGERVLALKSLVNTQSADIYPLVEPYLQAEQLDTRAAAHQALGGLDDPASHATLLNTLSQDPESRVRQSALMSLTQRPDQSSAATVTAVAKQLPQETNEELRTGLIQFLGAHKQSDPSAVAALQQQLRQETDRNLLKEVYKALYQPTTVPISAAP